jgi:DNA-binding CsgD family transcriptional regulator/tetratricopeptide (TPR) repeat protein
MDDRYAEASPSRRDAGTSPAPGDGPLVGREAELDRLVGSIRADRTIAVIGEAGIGKTTLIRAATSTAGRVLYEGGGFATLAWMPYLAIRRAAGVPIAGDPEVVAARVERLVGPDVLLIDDLQWTDAATRTVVGLLLDRIALVVAIRDGDPAASDALEPLEARRIEVIRLGGLHDEASLTLIRRLHPGASSGQLRRIVDGAGGNPLLLEELATRGESSSSLSRAIIGQLAALPKAERLALELLAVADRPLPANAVGTAGDRLLQRGLVVRGTDGLAVRHSLIAEAIAAQIDDERRRALHGRLSELLSDPAERATHLAAAGRRSEACKVATSALDAVSDPRTRTALLRVAAQTSDTEASLWRVRAAQELHAIGSPDEAITLLRDPLDGDDDLQALGVATLASSLDHEGRNDEALAVIDAARHLRPTPGSEGAMELAIAETVILVNQGRLDAALVIAERTAASAGDAARNPRLAGHLAALGLYAGRTDRLDRLEGAVEGSLAAGAGGAAASRAMDLYYMTLALRGATPAVAVVTSAADRLERLGFHTRAAELRAESVQAVIFAGDLGDAVARIDTMLEEPLGLLSRQRLGYNRVLALGLLGRFEDAERTAADVDLEVTDTFDGRGSLLWCRAEATLWSGRPERALDLATESLAFTAFNDAEFVLPSLTRAWAEVEHGRVPTDAAFAGAFRALAGATPELLGLQARARGDVDAAADAFDAAADLWKGFHQPRALLCRWAAADARRVSVGAAAVPALEAVLAEASVIGFEPLAARVRRSLRLAGVRIAAARGRGSIMELTAREAEVVTLVEQGLTNVEISRRLGLGRPTVARLVASAMGKLGVERRAQLAARGQA